MSADTSLDEAQGPIHDAQVALTKAVWHCIVDASSMNVVMSGSEYNAAVRAFRRAIEAAIRAESEAKLEALQAWIDKRKARDKRGRDRYRAAHPDVHRKSARESMARHRAALTEGPTR